MLLNAKVPYAAVTAGMGAFQALLSSWHSSLEIHVKKTDPAVDEAIQRLNMQDGPTRRRLLAGTGLVSATAAASALLAACSSSTGSVPSQAATGAAANFPATPAWQFWFVNHVTTNPFFVPTQFGMRDPAALLGLSAPKWTGSTSSTVSQMLSAIDTAVAAKANGIATTVINNSPADTSFASRWRPR